MNALKHKLVLGFWWACVPVYLLAANAMKVLFLKDASYLSLMKAILSSDPLNSFLMFVSLPFLINYFNFQEIKKFTDPKGEDEQLGEFRDVALNYLLIGINFLIIISYLIIQLS